MMRAHVRVQAHASQAHVCAGTCVRAYLRACVCVRVSSCRTPCSRVSSSHLACSSLCFSVATAMLLSSSARAARATLRTSRFHAENVRTNGPAIHLETRARRASSFPISLSHLICSLFCRTLSSALCSRCVRESTCC
eukprot:5980268-Pleurochrysis_carterae.AAC.3